LTRKLDAVPEGPQVMLKLAMLVAKASRPAETPIRVVFSADQVNSWLPMEHVIERGGGGAGA
jgi:hypothetical protein